MRVPLQEEVACLATEARLVLPLPGLQGDRVNALLVNQGHATQYGRRCVGRSHWSDLSKSFRLAAISLLLC
jgi:hypothetical protein